MKTCEATLCPECISATTTVSGSLSPTQTHTGGCQKTPKNNPTLNHRRAHTHTQSRWHAHTIGHKHPQLQSTVQHIIPFWCSQSAFPSSPVTLQWLFGSSLNMRKISRPSFFLVINSICCFMVLWEWQRQAIPHYKIKSKKKIQFVVQQTLQMSWAQGVQSCQEIHKSSWTLEVMDMCLLLLASCVHRCSVSTNPSSQCQVTVASLRGWGGQTVSWPCLTISSFFS